ncbi:hypothetical protein DPEC_G00318540 [Dallia pectoralis]|uniref:Uncharacterized protein n=1 Tax=Dallia pectoralis TaxID=75939 RepID=A0ACC2F9G2_DALPE|nr:hypothetical protein DPEC_G00318540 [Dallia pectoralis]
MVSSGASRRRRDTEENQEENQKERRRALQARHRANLATLFGLLKTLVCPRSRKMPAKWKILDHAKGFLKEQEAYLSRLLLLKGIFFGNEAGPVNLDDVRDEYRRLYSHRSSLISRRSVGQEHHSGLDGEDMIDTSDGDSVEEGVDASAPSETSVTSVPNVLEFQGYLLFYRQTVDQLVCSGVLSQRQTSLAVVTEAITGLWDNFSPERRASYQDLVQDVYNVLNKEMVSPSEDSSVPILQQCVDLENLTEIYRNIMFFAKDQILPQEPTDLVDDEGNFLKCSEALDSDDM